MRGRRGLERLERLEENKPDSVISGFMTPFHLPAPLEAVRSVLERAPGPGPHRAGLGP